VSSADQTTHCYSTCRTGGRSYYVTCGMRFRDGDRGRDDAVQLWSDPLDAASSLGAPSKALVFSNIYSAERESDTVNIITPGKTFRHLNPLARGGLVMRTGGRESDWTRAWCEHFRTSTRVLDRGRQDALLEEWTKLAARGLADLPALDLLHTSPMQLCARALNSTVSLDDFRTLPVDTQLALAGLCGLTRVWRIPAPAQHAARRCA
jgi:hypothetical protein